MAKRNKTWAKKAREKLRSLLGHQCAKCSKGKRLEFDCIEPLGDKHHKMSVDQRTCFYRKQYLLGNLQLLCHWCHNKKALLERSEQPF